MTDNSRQTNRQALLAVNLLLLLLCAAGLAALIIAFSLSQASADRTENRISATIPLTLTATPLPTITATLTETLPPRLTSTPTPSRSPTITQTPSKTPTATGFPIQAASRPTVFPEAYKLVEWDAGKADRLAQQLQGYPDAAQVANPEQSSEAYYASYQYPAFALQEALLRYPEAPEADGWSWTLAYNQVLSGDQEAGETYANLIAGGLNRSEVEIDQLYAWFGLREERLDFFMVALSTPPGELGSYLIELRNEAGSAFIWLLQGISSYQAEALVTQFDFTNPRQANWIVADVNGNPADGEEAAIYFSNLEDETLLQPPVVYNLAGEEPLVLPFIPEDDIFQLGAQFTNYWAAVDNSAGGKDLVFQTSIFPACPLNLMRRYHWNGQYFKLVETDYGFEQLPADLSFCEADIDHSANYFGPQATIDLMEVLLPNWPPTQDAEGNPYPADEKDEWHYRLGVYHALTGDFEGAVEWFNLVSTQPSVPTSRWVQPAQEFLAIYQKPVDIYKACVQAQFCNPATAIEYLTGLIPSSQDALSSLRQWGVTTTSSGFFDFDQDEEAERWLTIRHVPRAKLEFWILARFSGGYRALRVAEVETRQPTLTVIEEAYIDESGLNSMPAVLLDGKIAFSMQRLPDNQEPFLVEVPLRKEYPSRFFVPLEAYKTALLSGSSPEVIQEELIKLAEFPGLLCKPTWSCDEYYYLLGLASELAGDEEKAVETYHRLWLDYSKSPYTIMASQKLEPTAIPPTPTATPTGTATSSPTTSLTPSITPTGPTPTPSVSPTPTISGTPPTFTPTVSGTPQTPTPTVSGTPPTATSTPSPTTASTSGYPGYTPDATFDPYASP